MQDSKTDQEKYAEFRIHDYLGDLKFGAVLLGNLGSTLWSHFHSNFIFSEIKYCRIVCQKLNLQSR